MKITDILASHKPDEPFWTFEFFPPKTDPGMTHLFARIARMSSLLSPTWVHVTWGAGGSTQERSLELCAGTAEISNGATAAAKGIPTCLHLTCTNMETGLLEETLKRAKEIGIRNILALRGDPPRGEEYWVAASDEFQHAIDLVRYIRRHHGDYFCVGAAGYPETHPDSVDVNDEDDIRFLKEKVDAGVDFIVTQMFYDTDRFLKWRERCIANGITVPIIPGVMPIQNYQTFRRITNLCKVNVPDEVLAALEPIKADDQAVKKYGVRLAINMINQLRSRGVRGFHFCTLNLEKTVQYVLEGLSWLDTPEVEGASDGPRNKVLNGATTQTPNGALGKRDTSSASLSLLGGAAKAAAPARSDSPASWDEFPNGRFGDSRSPAYGDIDGWGVSLKLSPREALQHWGYPVTAADLSTIFSSYICGTIPAIPWCDQPLQLETSSIRDYLLFLNSSSRTWWTVGSQPAVDGASSTDPAFGFGPAGGYIYQKAFVEFFATEQDVQDIKRRAEAEGGGMVTYYAANRKGRFETNMARSALASDGAEEEGNAVTWGVFIGKEIVTTTFIEEVSFKAWKEEAFEIWAEWERLYAKQSATRNLLKEIGDARWLVSVVHHDYKDADGLWRFLGALDQTK